MNVVSDATLLDPSVTMQAGRACEDRCDDPQSRCLAPLRLTVSIW